MTEPYPGFEFYLEVSRAAHELACHQGTRALLIALSLAARARAKGDAEGERFWRVVSGSLEPR